jgi:hypothetical protein
MAAALLVGLLTCVHCSASEQANPLSSPAQLVREVVYNELHDHANHGYWRYMVEKRSQQGTRLEQQVETADGTVARLVLRNGRELSQDAQQSEQERLDHLLISSADQARLRQEHLDDEKRIGRILTLLPEAFLFEYVADENGCSHLRFHPNPDYPARSVEARVFHAMSGDLWIDARMKHLVRLDGQLQSNVDFGYGILGRLYKGGWFRLKRVQVSATDWKTERLEVHMNGRAMLFKTIARETSEIRGNFSPVPPAMNVEQGVDMLCSQKVAAVPRNVHFKDSAAAPVPR